jgi:hypothetical protein
VGCILGGLSISPSTASGQLGSLLDKVSKKDKHSKKSAEHPAIQPTTPSAESPNASSDQNLNGSGSAAAASEPKPSAGSNLQELLARMESQRKEIAAQEKSQLEASLKLKENSPVAGPMFGYKTLKWGKYDLSTLLVESRISPGQKVDLVGDSRVRPPRSEINGAPGNNGWTDFVTRNPESDFQGGESGNHGYIQFVSLNSDTVMLGYEGLFQSRGENTATKHFFTRSVRKSNVVGSDGLLFIPVGDERFVLDPTAAQEMKDAASKLKSGKASDLELRNTFRFVAEEEKEKVTVKRSLVFINGNFVAVEARYSFANQTDGARVFVDALVEKYGEPFIIAREGDNVGELAFYLRWGGDEHLLEARVIGVEVNPDSKEEGERFAKGDKSNPWKVIRKDGGIDGRMLEVRNFKAANQTLWDALTADNENVAAAKHTQEQKKRKGISRRTSYQVFDR